MDEIYRCKYLIIKELYDYCVEMAPVRIPRKRFKQVINDYESVPLEYAEENPSEESFEDDIEMRLTFDSFFSALSEMDKRIVAMKRKGIGEKEMAEELGCSMFTVSRHVSQIRQDLMECFKGGARCA